MPGDKPKLSKYARQLQVALKLNKHAAASDSVPASTTASQNSQASILAAEELRNEFESSYKALDIETASSFQDFQNQHRERLKKAIAKYPNSRINEETAKSWSCSAETARQVWTALCCSRDVNGQYELEHTESLFFGKTIQLVFEQALDPSPLGTRKRVMIWTDMVSGTLFVAVRGSKAWYDHVVNGAADAKHDPFIAEELDGSHGGFLSCMKELIPSLQEIFIQRVQTNLNIRHVVFTGESSGGAVASLLFFYFASQCNEVLGHARRSLITFGSPPVTSRNLTTLAEGLPSVESVLAFVNEGDVISRLSLDYSKSIVRLYRKHVEGMLERRQQAASIPGGVELKDNNVKMAGKWKLPDPGYYQIGRIIILRPSLVGKHMRTPGCSELSYSDFAQLLWCDTVVHKGSTYTGRVSALVRRIDPDILPPSKALNYGTLYQWH